MNVTHHDDGTVSVCIRGLLDALSPDERLRFLARAALRDESPAEHLHSILFPPSTHDNNLRRPRLKVEAA